MFAVVVMGINFDLKFMTLFAVVMGIDIVLCLMVAPLAVAVSPSLNLVM